MKHLSEMMAHAAIFVCRPGPGDGTGAIVLRVWKVL